MKAPSAATRKEKYNERKEKRKEEAYRLRENIVQSEDNDSSSDEDIPKKIGPHIVHVDLRIKEKIMGMTVVDDQLFIVDSQDTAVNVYDSNNLTFQRRINIPDMKDPQGLAGCSHNKVLYISDSELKCIHRVNLTDNKVIKWKLSERYHPYALAVTPEHNVLITVKMKDTGEENPEVGDKSKNRENDSEAKTVDGEGVMKCKKSENITAKEGVKGVNDDQNGDGGTTKVEGLDVENDKKIQSRTVEIDGGGLNRPAYGGDEDESNKIENGGDISPIKVDRDTDKTDGGTANSHKISKDDINITDGRDVKKDFENKNGKNILKAGEVNNDNICEGVISDKKDEFDTNEADESISFRILEYTSDGKLKQDITSIKRAWEMAQFSTGQFIVCHELWDAFIKELDDAIATTGVSPWTSHAEREKEKNQLSKDHLAKIHDRSCRVFVGGSGITNLLMFGRDLTFIGQVNRPVGTNSAGLCYDSSSNRLFCDDSYTILDILPEMTVVDDQIFAILLSKSVVLVYDAFTFNDQPRIIVPDMNNPRAIAGCPHNKALYIRDDYLKRIIRVNLIDRSFSGWLMDKKWEQLCLSVTSKYSILVTEQIKDIRGESRVVEYTSEGELIRIIKPDKSIYGAWQTVQLSSDLFVICHGLYNFDIHRICVINSEGQIIKSYGGERGEGEDQLHCPGSIAIDENKGHVFVADCHNNRILMLNRDLNYIGQVQARAFSRSMTIVFDSSSDRLFVREFSTGPLIIICSPDQFVETF